MSQEQARSLQKLPAECFYFPIEKGIYEVAPGLRPLGFDSGNGDAEKRVFQIDERFQKYLDNKRACRKENLGKYLLFHEHNPSDQKVVASFLVNKYCEEYPQYFFKSDLEGNTRLECRLTNETLTFDQDFALVHVTGQSPQDPPYANSFDALSTQVPEDVAVMKGEGGRNFLSAIQLCASGHWSPAEKIGRDFFEIHKPVPGIDKINRSAESFVEAMIRKGPFARFAWGFATDNRLNHHPEPPPGVAFDQWHGRKFHSPLESKFFLRVERQVMVGFPTINSSLFTIRVYYFDGERLKSDAEKSALLASALESMTPDQRRYKGLEGSLEPLLAWLRE